MLTQPLFDFQFAEQQLNVKLFHENDDPDTWISMVPTSAHSGDGMGNLMAYVVQHCQSRLAKRLAFSENLQCTVLEVKMLHAKDIFLYQPICVLV